jgi:hypothetical protein
LRVKASQRVLPARRRSASRGVIRAHHGRRLRDAHVDQVRDAGAPRRSDARLDRCEIDALELLRLGGIRMRRADEMHERRRRWDRGCERGGVERVADDRRCADGQLAGRFGANERGDGMTARDESRDQFAADVAGSAGHEDVHPIG